MITMSEFISKEYYSLEKKLTQNEYKDFKEYLKELVVFQEYLVESGP